MRIRRAARALAADRGDILVTPAMIIFGIGMTVLLGVLAGYGANKVAPKVESSRQGLTLDDQGNIVQGAAGAIPTATPKPTPAPTPEEHTRVITRERVIEREPAADPTPIVIVTNPHEPTDAGESHSSNTSDGNTSNDHEPPPDDGHGCCG